MSLSLLQSWRQWLWNHLACAMVNHRLHLLLLIVGSGSLCFMDPTSTVSPWISSLLNLPKFHHLRFQYWAPILSFNIELRSNIELSNPGHRIVLHWIIIFPLIHWNLTFQLLVSSGQVFGNLLCRKGGTPWVRLIPLSENTQKMIFCFSLLCEETTRKHPCENEESLPVNKCPGTYILDVQPQEI